MAKKKKEKSLLIRLLYKILGVLSVGFCVTSVLLLSASLFKPVVPIASAVVDWFGFSAIVFCVVFYAWGMEAIKNTVILSFFSRFFAFVLGMSLFSGVLNLVPIFRPGMVGKVAGRKIMSFINNFGAPSEIRYVMAFLLFVLALLCFNFACGISFKTWAVGIKKVCVGFFVCVRGFFRAITYIFARKKADVKENKLVQKPVKEKQRIEPKVKAESLKPTIVAKKENAKQSDYIKPSIALLSRPGETKAAIPEKELEKIAHELEATLSEFGVNGSIVKIRPGPVVTLYELEPAPGTKTARVISLADDIARSMSVASVRIAVVTNSNTIGIELPNPSRETVWLRSLVDDINFTDSKNTLNIVLGKDIGGTNVYADLAKMPHLLVAGTTGSGKSVGINSMILSLLYKMSPEECKLIMIDPKMLELSVYNDIPHLLTPVITDPAKAVVGLKWAVKEMEDRYRNMAKLNVRNIMGYNKRLEELRESGKVVKRTVQTGFDPQTGKPIYEEEIMDLSPLPYIVIVVDEMADLMLVAGKDVEAAIQRLAQMARAAGIHLIMATQRPSVDVITGTIKSNFPTRISFQVTSKIDSRTILNEMGAEQLLGMGDMLYMPAGQRPLRVHGSFVKDSEVEKIVEFIKSQKQPEYQMHITESDEKTDGGAVFDKGSMGGGSEEDLYQQAVAIVQNDRKVSTSYIQRKLRIGYNRAASLVDRMETEGLISSADHVGRREVL